MTRVLHQQGEYLKFHRSQLCRFSVHHKLHSILIKFQPANPVNIAVLPAVLFFLPVQQSHKPVISPEMGVHSGQQLHRRKRLCNIIIGSHIQSHDFVHFLRFGRQKDYRKVIMLPEPDDHCHSVHPRHHDINNCQMDLLPLKYLKSFHSVGRLKYAVSLSAQENLNSFPDFLVILNQ